ncbi:hypothetical protein NDU88_006266 [Pleurodeles waltl]|uniref:Uncharacterized protein n=1 Tax=Pleurodeles waltl TaxID=8319 RepID=A0AAV7NPQ7_PLEWA|nr:hypothetical protein NDU88_006266 [Pleurodeles waltl]
MEFSRALALWLIFITKNSVVNAGCQGVGHLANGRAFFRYNGIYVTFSCNPGFWLLGHRSSSCVAGKWRRSPPVCVAGGCPVLQKSLHSKMRSSHSGSVMTFVCEKGYKLFGSATVYCNGKRWNSTTPVCEEYDMMSTIMKKDGPESVKSSLKMNRPSPLNMPQQDILAFLPGNTAPKIEFKLTLLPSQNHGKFAEKENYIVPLHKGRDYPIKDELLGVAGGQELSKTHSQEFEKNAEAHLLVTDSPTAKTTFSLPLKVTLPTPQGQIKARNDLLPSKSFTSRGFATTSSTALPSSLKPDTMLTFLNIIPLSTSTAPEKKVISTTLFDSDSDYLKHQTITKPSTLAPVTLFFSTISESFTRSGKSTKMGLSTSSLLPSSSTPFVTTTASSILQLHSSGFTDGIGLQSVLKDNSRKTTSQVLDMNDLQTVQSRLTPESESTDQYIDSRIKWKAFITPRSSTLMYNQNGIIVNKLNSSYYHQSYASKLVTTKRYESPMPQSQLDSKLTINGQTEIETNYTARFLNHFNSLPQTPTAHESISTVLTKHNEKNGKIGNSTMAPSSRDLALRGVESQMSSNRRSLCMYPPVPVHGTFHFQTIFNPKPHQFRYYIQYTCYPGYTMAHGDIYSFCLGNGTWSGVTPVCLEFAPCSINNGGCSQLCSPSEQRGIECSCREGFHLLDDERTCRDIDECAGTSHQCHHICTNTFGSYGCSCRPGFLLEDDEKTCNDLDECAFNNSGCSHHCANTFGSSMCYCPTGYEIDVDQKSCRGSFHCNCPDGYRLSADSWYCIDINECLDLENSEHRCEWKCINMPGSYYCVCPRGYRVSTDRYHCEDIDECIFQKAGCSHLCVNTPGGYKCECPNGHQLIPYSRKTCQPIRAKTIRIKGKTIKAS